MSPSHPSSSQGSSSSLSLVHPPTIVFPFLILDVLPHYNIQDAVWTSASKSHTCKVQMYVRDGLHLSRKGAAVFAEGLSGAVASGLGKVRYLN